MSTPIISHARQLDYLNRVLSRAKLAHAYLFHGPEHVGKLTVAKMMAKRLLCEEQRDIPPPSLPPVADPPPAGKLRRTSHPNLPPSEKGKGVSAGFLPFSKGESENEAWGCNSCQSCRLIENDTHPEVVLLDREHSLVSEKESRKEIPIDDIRKLKRRFCLAAAGDTWRVAIINEAEKMNEEAANAFLKLLEEPGSHTLFILVTAHRESILPTIISRTIQIAFSLISQKELEDFFSIGSLRLVQGSSFKLKKEYLLIANGRPGVLVRLIADDVFAKEEMGFLKAMIRLMQDRTPSSLLGFCATLVSDESRRAKALEYIVRGLRKELLGSNASREEKSRIIQKIKRIDRIAALMDTTNVNTKLAMDAVMMEIV